MAFSLIFNALGRSWQTDCPLGRKAGTVNRNIPGWELRRKGRENEVTGSQFPCAANIIKNKAGQP